MSEHHYNQWLASNWAGDVQSVTSRCISGIVEPHTQGISAYDPSSGHQRAFMPPPPTDVLGLNGGCDSTVNMLSAAQPTQSNPWRQAPKSSTISRSTRKNLDWDSVKDVVKKHYFDEGLTGNETIAILKEEHNFLVTEKLFKSKIKDWGFGKYNKGNTARWMLEKEKKRKLENKETTFKLHGQTITRNQIERTAKKSKTTAVGIIDETPPGVSYQTPSIMMLSPLAVFTPAPSSSSARQRWKPEERSKGSVHKPQIIWRDITRKGVHDLQKLASHLEGAGRWEDAEEKFRAALSAMQHLLPPMHDETVQSAYNLACFYMRHDCDKDSYAIIQWLIHEHIELWGVYDMKTLSHLEHSMDLMASWNRDDDAAAMMNQFWGLTSPRHGSAVVSAATASVMEPFESEIALARLKARTDSFAAEETLLDLQEKYNEDLKSFATPALHVCDALLSVYTGRGDLAKQTDLLTRASQSLGDLLWNSKKDHEALLRAALRLVKHCFSIQLFDVADSMSREIEATAVETLDEGTASPILILISLGELHQTVNRWDKARPYFEHALCRALDVLRPSNPLIIKLQHALDEEHFGVLPREDGSKLFLRFPHDECHC